MRKGLGRGKALPCLHLWRSWARAWVVVKLFPVFTSGGHGQGLGSWQSSSLSPPLTVMGKGLGRGKALPCLHLWRSWARAWVVAKLFPVSTSDGHEQGLGSLQSSSLSTWQCYPSISFSACPFFFHLELYLGGRSSIGHWHMSHDHTIAVFFTRQC